MVLYLLVPNMSSWCGALAWAALPCTALFVSLPHVCIFYQITHLLFYAIDLKLYNIFNLYCVCQNVECPCFLLDAFCNNGCV